jgi:hypothetical protein
MIRLRALVSANDAGALWDLRCLVRERLVSWVWENERGALPRFRADTDPPRPSRAPAVDKPAGSADDSGQVFAGSTDGAARGAAFVGPDEPHPTSRHRVSDSSLRQD